MTTLAGALKLHVPAMLTSGARDVVEHGEAAHNLEVFGQMPLIDNGPLSWLVLVQKCLVLAQIGHQFLSHPLDLAGAIRI